MKFLIALIITFGIKPIIEQAFFNDIREKLSSINSLANLPLANLIEAVLLAFLCFEIYRLFDKF